MRTPARKRPADPTTTTRSGQAAVVGGSIAGLLAAAVLAEHFEQVTVIDRDRLPASPAPRRGTPQAVHQHVLLAQGRRLLEELLPGLQDDLVAMGTPEVDMAAEVAWLTPAGWGARFPSQLKLLCASRDLLEWAARRRVAAHPRVRLLDGHRVDGLRGDHGRVTGVQVHPGGGRGEARTLAADLVVDASGRGSPAPRWLAELGYRPPLETVVNAFLGYSSRTYRPPAGWQAHWRGAYVQQAPPDGTRGGVMFPMEGGRWLITLAGAARDWPPTDEAGFLEFARSLRDPILYDAIRAAEPLGPIHGIRATANRLRHYERLADRPEGFLVLGDAACAFNPVYAQGMTIACMGAAALRQTLAARRRRHPDGDLSGLARRFQQRLAKVNSAPWMLATGQDHRYPATEGAPPPRINALLDRYLDRVVASSTEDPAARLALLETFTMLRPPTALFRPRVMARVLTRTRGRNGPAQPAASPASDAQLRVPTR